MFLSPLAGISDFFKPFVPEWFLEESVELFAGYTRYDFFESFEREMMDWVVVAGKKYSKALESKLRDMREVEMRVKDLKWMILAACTSPQGKKLSDCCTQLQPTVLGGY